MNKLTLMLTLCTLIGCSTRYSVDNTSKSKSSANAEADTVVEAYSLFGRLLTRPAFSPQRRNELDAQLAVAKNNFDNNPNDPENIIWLGRRTAYLSRYREAIDIYSRGIEKFPTHFKLYRHRGHRYITIREFDKAIGDLEKAASLIHGVPDEVEQDGLPNKYNIPTSTSHTNIWYHLGLAYYLKEDFENARRCYLECLTLCKNDDILCATTDWLYMTCRRVGLHDEAKTYLEPINVDMTIYEDSAYHRRLLMYKGELQPSALLDTSGANDLTIATQGYGVGNWYFYNGEIEKAKQIFEQVITGSNWAAFGYIAAEAELYRMSKKK